MTVHFIGAGPGAPDLITLRGLRLIQSCPVCLYAGSLVHPDILAFCPEGARIVDTAPMSLDEIVAVDLVGVDVVLAKLSNEHAAEQGRVDGAPGVAAPVHGG